MWSRLHEQCVECGSTEHPHKGKGLCTACYYKGLRLPQAVETVVEVPSDELERFVAALPSLLKEMGVYGWAVTYQAGQVTFKQYQGSKKKIAWP